MSRRFFEFTEISMQVLQWQGLRCCVTRERKKSGERGGPAVRLRCPDKTERQPPPDPRIRSSGQSVKASDDRAFCYARRSGRPVRTRLQGTACALKTEAPRKTGHLAWSLFCDVTAGQRESTCVCWKPDGVLSEKYQ